MSTAVTVTEPHIDAGMSGSCSRCPVALALAGAFPGTDIWVNGATFDIRPWGGDYTRVNLRGGVEEFIVRFDEDGFGEPFTFTVDYPEAAA